MTFREELSLPIRLCDVSRRALMLSMLVNAVASRHDEIQMDHLPRASHLQNKVAGCHCAPLNSAILPLKPPVLFDMSPVDRTRRPLEILLCCTRSPRRFYSQSHNAATQCYIAGRLRLFDPSPVRESSPIHLRSHPRAYASKFSTTSASPAVSTPRAPTDLRSKDRGPASKEDTQTDFSVLDVLGGTANPSTSVDICMFDGFMLDSGLRIAEGDGVILTGSEAFVWRPWMGANSNDKDKASSRDRADLKRTLGIESIVSGNSLREGRTETERTGGILNSLGQFEVPESAWGLFGLLWPKPGGFC